MIRFRPFRNSDPPDLAEIWQRQRHLRGVMDPMTPWLLESLVFSKPYFDPEALIVAARDGQPIGFVHAGFGPLADGSQLDYGAGVTCLLMGDPDGDGQLDADLLARSEEYLVKRGAETLWGGCFGRLSPFYLGLYGGSQPAGILASDVGQLDAFRAAGYTEARRTSIFQLELARFRPVMDRQTVQLRRRMQLKQVEHESLHNWWEACTLGQIDQVRFELASPADRRTVGAVNFWDVQPLASSWKATTKGLLELRLDDADQPVVLGGFLLGQAMKELQRQGTQLMEVQVGSEDQDLEEICKRLGFREIDQGVQFQKAV